MRHFLFPTALALSVAACGASRGRQARVPSPETLFPLSQSWLLPLESPLAGPLATDGTRLFFVTRPGGLQAVDVASGNDLWRLPERTGVPGAAPGRLGVRDADGRFWAHEPETGVTRGKVASGVPGELPPTLADDVAVVAGRGLAVLDLEAGKVLWSAETTEAATVPVLHKDRVLLGLSDGTRRAWQVRTGAPIWSARLGSGPLSAPAVDDHGRLFLGTAARRLQSLSVDKGSKRWSWKVGTDAPFPSALAAGKVFFVTNEAVLYAFRAGNGHLAWRAALPSRPLSPPILVRDTVLVACNGTRPSESLLLGFDVSTGRRVGELRTSGEIHSGPLLAGSQIVVELRHPRALVAFARHP